MTVLVYQSHPRRVAGWMLRCTTSVRSWAERNGYDYRLLGDELFEGIPLDISLKAQSVLPMTDLGRLLWAERLLASWECVIWIDADVLVFDPEHFSIDTQASYLVCREVLVTRKRDDDDVRVVQVAYSPTVLMFRRGAGFLKRWITAAMQSAARRPGLGDAELGRELLRQIAPKRGLPAIRSVGHFNAAILKEIHGQPGASIEAMMAASGVAFSAANLCGHHNLPSAAYLRVVDRLLATGGSVVNAHLPSNSLSRSPTAWRGG